MILVLITLLIRLPFFFRDYIDRDESTFILMAESWLNGHLPYTELWDLKPPLVYLVFAFVISLFGKSFIALRMAGVLAVSLTAYFTYAIGRHAYSGKVGFGATIACVYLLSLFGSLQGVMSEHLSMLFFMPGLFLLIKASGLRHYAIAGVLMGFAVMTKLNLAFAIALITLYLLYDGYREHQPWKGLINAFIFGFLVLLVIFLTWLPYILEGQSQLWWNSVVLAPLEYTGARRYPLLKMAPIVIFVCAFFYLSIKKQWLQVKDPANQLLGLAVIGVVLSFVKGGRVNGHYLIQFHPIFLVLLGIVLSRSLPSLSAKAKAGLWILALLLPAESYKEYFEVARHKIERGSFFNGEGFTVPQYLIENKLETEDVFFLEYHVGYWMLPAKPPTRAATHPSNLCRDELFRFYGNPRRTSMEELEYIMETLRPTIVVTRLNRRIFDRKEEEENIYMVDYLRKRYEVIAIVDQAEIHRRL
jgi:4-amino-4-deoxy-L-arabinose transferase-like glycosyltransferase